MNKFSSLLDEPSTEELHAFWKREAFKAQTRLALAQAEYELAVEADDACRVLADVLG